MTAETAFLTTLAARLAAAGLLPAPALVGTVLPATAAELPALVLALDEVRRQGAGLGERASLVTGALAVTARIDLANPVLPEEPTFRLLGTDRLSLVLPHGGWVKADGSEGSMASTDLQVSVAGVARTVVNAAPGATEVRPDPAIGTLLFGAPLPTTGVVQATYFVGQWERRVQPIAGVLVIDVRAATAADTQALSDALLEALDDPADRPNGLRTLAPLSLSAVGRADPTLAGARGRLLRIAYEYEHIVDRPDPSGGVIHRVPITTQLLSTTVDPVSGAFVTALVSEADP